MVDAVANLASSTSSTSKPAIKAATPELINFSDVKIDEATAQAMIDLVFEDIGGQEMISIVRNDLVNGQNQNRQTIKNLSRINLDYNPNNILSLQDTSASYFANFPINFEEKVPDKGFGPNGEIVYLEESTGNIIISVIKLKPDEQIEVQILNNGSIFNKTKYEVD